MTFYGACPTCGVGYWADVTTTTMCVPTLIVVCQRHVPVSDVELGNSGMFAPDNRGAWDRWRRQSQAAGAATLSAHRDEVDRFMLGDWMP